MTAPAEDAPGRPVSRASTVVGGGARRVSLTRRRRAFGSPSGPGSRRIHGHGRQLSERPRHREQDDLLAKSATGVGGRGHALGDTTTASSSAGRTICEAESPAWARRRRPEPRACGSDPIRARPLDFAFRRDHHERSRVSVDTPTSRRHIAAAGPSRRESTACVPRPLRQTSPLSQRG
jgi:hypothetical protein